MSTGQDIAALLTILVGVFGSLTIVGVWTRSLADWLWLLALRRGLVASLSLVILLAAEAVPRILFGLPFLSAIGLLTGFLVTPLATIFLANRIAYWLARKTRGREARARDFIFDDARRRQTKSYSLPSNET